MILSADQKQQAGTEESATVARRAEGVPKPASPVASPRRTITSVDQKSPEGKGPPPPQKYDKYDAAGETAAWSTLGLGIGTIIGLGLIPLTGGLSLLAIPIGFGIGALIGGVIGFVKYMKGQKVDVPAVVNAETNVEDQQADLQGKPGPKPSSRPTSAPPSPRPEYPHMDAPSERSAARPVDMPPLTSSPRLIQPPPKDSGSKPSILAPGSGKEEDKQSGQLGSGSPKSQK